MAWSWYTIGVYGFVALLVFLAWLLSEPKKKLFKVTDKIIVITGGTSGLGFELGRECLERGAKRVILLARHPLAPSNNLFKLFPDRVDSLSCDVTDRGQLAQVKLSRFFVFEMTITRGYKGCRQNRQ